MLRTSVCLITYNHERTIRDALDSVLGQRTSFPFEVVVGDDASTDETPRILAEYQARHPDRIRLRLAPRNQGATANFLGVFNACTGPLVAILEGDDYWTSPDKLQLQVSAMEANPTATLCGTNALVVDERRAHRRHEHPGECRAYLTGVESILTANFFSTCTTMVRKNGDLAVPPGLETVWGDWALKLHFALGGDTLFLPQQTGCYRVSGDGMWSSLNRAEQESEVLRVLRTFERYVGPAHAHVLEPRIRKQLTAVAKAWKSMGDESKAEAALGELESRPAAAPVRDAAPRRRPIADFPGAATKHGSERPIEAGTSFYGEDELAMLGLARCGKDVRISRHCRIYSAGTIAIGDHVRIDDFCILSGRITIGNYVHVAAYTALYGGGGIVVGDFAAISARVLVYSVCDDFSGEHLANPTVPASCRAVTSAPVQLERFAIVGAGSILLPGVTLHEGAAVGAMSLVRDDAPAWKITMGNPARAIAVRARGMVEMAAGLEAGQPQSEGSAR